MKRGQCDQGIGALVRRGTSKGRNTTKRLNDSMASGKDSKKTVPQQLSVMKNAKKLQNCVHKISKFLIYQTHKVSE